MTISGKGFLNLKDHLYIIASFPLNAVVTEDTYLKKNLYFFLVFPVFLK